MHPLYADVAVIHLVHQTDRNDGPAGHSMQMVHHEPVRDSAPTDRRDLRGAPRRGVE